MTAEELETLAAQQHALGAWVHGRELESVAALIRETPGTATLADVQAVRGAAETTRRMESLRRRFVEED